MFHCNSPVRPGKLNLKSRIRGQSGKNGPPEEITEAALRIRSS